MEPNQPFIPVEEQFRIMADTAPVLIWISGIDKLCYFFNAGWLRFTGRTMEQERGNGWAEGVHPDDFQRCLDIYTSSFDARKEFKMEYRLRRHDGKYRWLVDNGVPRYTADGTFAGYIGSCMDIDELLESERVKDSLSIENLRTEQFLNEELEATNEALISNVNELRQSQDDLREMNANLEDKIAIRTKALDDKISELTFLADSIPSIVWTSDADGKLDYINSRWHERNPARENLPLGDSWLNNLHPDDKDKVKEAWAESIKTGNPYEIEFRILNRHGNYQWYLVRALPMRDDTGKIVKWYGNNTDIQQQKELQQQKDDFITIASHELKTPLTSLKASLQLLDKIKDNPPAGMLPRLILQSRKSMEKISTLVDDLLNVKRLQEGQLKLNKTNFVISELINTICNPIAIGGKHRINILGDKTLKIYADEHRIDQVITNFVSNATKYAPESEVITITIEQLHKIVRISVIDKGPGIAADKLPHIFKRYFRVDHSSEKYSGLGLGLYISSEIIDRHHGEIGADSQLGEGSTFWFTLPLQ